MYMYLMRNFICILGFNVFEYIINLSFKLCIFYNLYRHVLESTSVAKKLSYGCRVEWENLKDVFLPAGKRILYYYGLPVDTGMFNNKLIRVF